MKILYVNYGLGSGGAERLTVDLANKMASNNKNEVIMISVFDLGLPKYSFFVQYLNKRIKLISLKQHKGLSINGLRQIYNIIKKERPDVVHCHSSLLLITIPAIFNRRPKYVHTLHSLANACLVRKWRYPLFNFLYKYKVQAVTISKECSNSYRTLYKMSNDILVANGSEKMETTSDRKIAETEILSVTHNKRPVFINVARFDPPKNHKVLFKVFERIAEEGLPYQLIVVGAKHEENASYYANHPNIHFLGTKRNVSDYLDCSNYFILSSTREGLPITLLEAMSIGCIPICTPAGGIPNVIQNGTNGFLADGFSEVEIYDVIKKAITSSDTINKQTIIDDYQVKYSMDICAGNYLKVYES